MTLSIMELSTLNMDVLGSLGCPEQTFSANDLFEGLTWDLNTIPEGPSSLTSLNQTTDEEWKPFRELDEIQEVSAATSSAVLVVSGFKPETEFSLNSTQNLIDEVEDFLVHHEIKTTDDDSPLINGSGSMSPASSIMSSTSTNNETREIILDPRMETSFMEICDDSGVVCEDDVVYDDHLLESETKMAEEVLDALMNGNITTASPTPSLEDTHMLSVSPVAEPILLKQQPTTVIRQQRHRTTTTLNEIFGSGGAAANVVDCSKLTNVSEFILEDGRNVIIMIAAPSSSPSPIVVPDSESSSIDGEGSFTGSNPASPSSPSASVSVYSDDGDSEWSPQEESSSNIVSKSSKRGSPRTALPPPVKKGITKKIKTIIDKKERKKWQNVEAARRYRDKKKVEQGEYEEEVSTLQDRNANLKGKLGEMENELSTLKKLMTEMGLIKTM